MVFSGHILNREIGLKDLLFIGIGLMTFSIFPSYGEDRISCPEKQTHIEGNRLKKWCDSSGNLIGVDILFSKKYGEKISQSFQIREEKIVNIKHFDIEQRQTQEIDQQHLPDGSIVETQFSVSPLRGYIKGKYRKLKNEQGTSDTLEAWIYDVDKQAGQSTLTNYISYRPGTKVPTWKGFYKKDGNTMDFWQEYFYDSQTETRTSKLKIIKLRQYDSQKNLEFEYSSDGPFTFEQLYSDKPHPEPKPLGVVVIDSGFETDHPGLVNHWFQNPMETFDGKDNDGNGIVDDVYGYSYGWDGKSSSNIREVGYVERPTDYYYSHGTHVANLAVDGLSKWSLAGFGGDMTSPKLLNHARDFIKKHKAPFVNISIVYGNGRNGGPSAATTFESLQKLIYKNKQSLFFIAAPNAHVNIDEVEDFPSSYPYKNTMVVSSIDAADWADHPNPIYAKPVYDAAIGVRNVDIFAPGSDVMAAYFGKTYKALSGNSMATPKALNIVAKVAEIYPDIPNAILKKLFLLSAYIPNLDDPMPCVSGGVAYPQRFQKAAELFSKGQNLSDAAINSRKESSSPIGEASTDEYFDQLKNFWKSRGLIE